MKVGDNTNFGVITEIKENSVCCGKNKKGVDTWIKKSSIIIIQQMKDFKVGDKVLVVKTDYPKNVPIGTVSVVSSLANGVFPRIKVGENYEWIFSPNELKLIDSFESTTKKIKQSLLRLYLSDTNKTIKSEKIIDYVKQEIGTEYIFGDTILRALRQLRQDGKLDYIIDGAKQDRNYKFKAV
jgi:hypothetical protein